MSKFFKRFFCPIDSRTYAPPDDPSGPTVPATEPVPDDPTPAPVDPPADPPVDPSAPEPDPTGDPTPDPTDYGAILEESGLLSRYGSPEAALRAIPEQQATITRMQQENAEFRRMLTQMTGQKKDDAPKGPSQEEITELWDAGRHAEALDKMGFARKTDVDTLSAEQQDQAYRNEVREATDQLRDFPELKDVAEYASRTFSSQNPTPFPVGKNKVWDAMMAEAVESGVRPDSQNLRLLYKAVKGNAPATNSPVSTNKKERAKTAGGPGQPKSDDALPDYSDPKWTADKIKADAKKRGLYFERY